MRAAIRSARGSRPRAVPASTRCPQSATLTSRAPVMPAAISSARCGGVSSSCAPTSTSVGQSDRGEQRARVRARHDRLLLAHERLRADVVAHREVYLLQRRVGAPVADAPAPATSPRSSRRSGRSRPARCGCGASPAPRADRRARRCRAAPAGRRGPPPGGRFRAPRSRPSKGRRARNAAAPPRGCAARSPPCCRRGCGPRPSPGRSCHSSRNLRRIEPRRAVQPGHQNDRQAFGHARALPRCILRRNIRLYRDLLHCNILTLRHKSLCSAATGPIARFDRPPRAPMSSFRVRRGVAPRAVTHSRFHVLRPSWLVRKSPIRRRGHRLYDADPHPRTGHSPRAGAQRRARHRADRHRQDGGLRAADDHHAGAGPRPRAHAAHARFSSRRANSPRRCRKPSSNTAPSTSSPWR